MTARPGVSPEVMHFELNRSLTGMGIERYAAGRQISGDRPPDVLAKRLFEAGATNVTVYSNVVTVTAPAETWSRLREQVEEILANLFIYYRDGVVPAVPAVPAVAEGEPAAPE